MANAIYTKAKEKLLSGSINLPSDTIKALLVDGADYTPNVAAHEFLSDIAAAAREETSVALTGKTITGGVFDATDVTFAGAAGDPCEYVVIFKDTGTVGTSPLLAIFDTATGLPVILNGGDVIVQWDNGANKIFAL